MKVLLLCCVHARCLNRSEKCSSGSFFCILQYFLLLIETTVRNICIFVTFYGVNSVLYCLVMNSNYEGQLKTRFKSLSSFVLIHVYSLDQSPWKWYYITFMSGYLSRPGKITRAQNIGHGKWTSEEQLNQPKSYVAAWCCSIITEVIQYL